MIPYLIRINETLSTLWIQVMLIEVKHQDFPRGQSSQYYSSLSVLNYKVSSKVKPTLLATPFAKPSLNVMPYELFIRNPLKLINK